MTPHFVPAPPISPEECWSFRKMPQGASVDCSWVGPVHGLQTHHLDQTKPCLKDFTGGDLDCPYCAHHVAKRWRGYCPAVDFSGKQIVFLVGRQAGQLLELVAAGTVLTFKRGSWETAPVVFETFKTAIKTPIGRRFTGDGVYAKGVDLTPWLVRLWEIPELNRWFQKGV